MKFYKCFYSVTSFEREENGRKVTATHLVEYHEEGKPPRNFTKRKKALKYASTIKCPTLLVFKTNRCFE